MIYPKTSMLVSSANISCHRKIAIFIVTCLIRLILYLFTIDSYSTIYKEFLINRGYRVRFRVNAGENACFLRRLLNFVCFRIEISVLLCIVVCDLEHDK